MTEDTRNADAIGPAASRGAANPSEGEARSEDGDGRTVAERNMAALELTPGRRYVATYLLQEADNNADTSWIAECINDGRLIACPRCHFLHLPFRPFPLSRKQWETAPPDACDVCAAVPVLCNPINWGGDEDWEKALAYAGADVADERTMRAITLYHLWVEAANGADALRVAAIANGLNGLLASCRGPAAEAGGG